MTHPSKYRPPEDIPPIDGLPVEGQRQLQTFLRRQFLRLAEDLATVTRNDAPTVVYTDTRLDVPAGAKRRVTPPVAGMTVVLEAPSQFNAGDEVVLFVEAPRGTLKVISAPGVDDGGKVFLPSVNGARQATYTAAGVISLRSNGSNAWSSPAEIPVESPASPQALIISSPGATGARGATGPTGLGTALFPLLFENDRSEEPVAFALPQQAREPQEFDITILTDTTWTNFDLAAAFPGIRPGDTIAIALAANLTIDSIIPPSGGFWCFAGINHESGDFALTITDGGDLGTTNQFRTPGQPFGAAPFPYVIRSKEDWMVWAHTPITQAWRVIAGTAAQRITGDVEVQPGLGGTRIATLTGAGASKAITFFPADAAEEPAPFVVVPRPSWADTLQVSAHSGAHDPLIDSGRFIGFGDAASAALLDGDIRAGVLATSGVFKIRSDDDLNVQADHVLTLQSSTSDVDINATVDVHMHGINGIHVDTAGVARLRIDNTGAWLLKTAIDPGVPGAVITSQGAGAPPVWASPAVPALLPALLQGDAAEEPGSFLSSITPGPTGPTGPTGPSGSGGSSTMLVFPGEPSADEGFPFIITQTGATGATGATGTQGPQGASAFPVFPPDLISEEPTQFELALARGAQLPVIQPGSFIGLQITAASAATAIEITGVNAGENIRFDTWVTDSASVGNQIDYSPAGSTAATTGVRLNMASLLNIQGMALAGGSGKMSWLAPSGATPLITLEHASASELTAARRFQNPGGLNLQLLANENALVMNDSAAGRVRIMALARARHAVQAAAGAISPAETLNFVNSTLSVSGGVASITDALLGTVNTGSFSAFSNLNLTSTDSSIVITGPPAAGTFAPNFITNRGGQNAMDLGTSTITTASPADRGFRPGLVSNSALVTVTNSTASNPSTTYTIPANTLVAGSTYLIVGFLNINRGATTTASVAALSAKFAGTTRSSLAGFSVNATATTGATGIVIGAFTCFTTGATGTGIMRLFALGQWLSASALVAAGDLTTGTPATFTVNTTVNNTVNLAVAFGTAVASLSSSWTNCWVGRVI